MVRNGKPDVITVVMWKKKAVNKCHFIAQQPFWCHIFASQIDTVI